MSDIREVPQRPVPKRPRGPSLTQQLKKFVGNFIGVCMIACVCVGLVTVLVWLIQNLIRMVR
jgi:hypothetical protein